MCSPNVFEAQNIKRVTKISCRSLGNTVPRLTRLTGKTSVNARLESLESVAISTASSINESSTCLLFVVEIESLGIIMSTRSTRSCVDRFFANRWIIIVQNYCCRELILFSRKEIPDFFLKIYWKKIMRNSFRVIFFRISFAFRLKISEIVYVVSKFGWNFAYRTSESTYTSLRGWYRFQVARVLRDECKSIHTLPSC